MLISTKKKKKKSIKQKNLSKKGLLSKVFILCINIGVSMILFSTAAYANDLWTNAQKLVDDVYGKFVALSTGAAGVGFGIGAYMKKFSRGKQQVAEMGDKVQWDSVKAWAGLNGLGLILNFLKPYLK